MFKKILDWYSTKEYKGIIKQISPNDMMYKAAPNHYFWWGNEALKRTNITLGKYGQTEIKRILILPSGHGRELRFFKVAFPGADITACDIDKDGVDFCVETFGVKGVFSNKDPIKVNIGDSFDFIWCGSLLTHLDSEDWQKFLTFFAEHLNPNAILIFTTHGDFMTDEFRKGKLDLGIDEETKQEILSSYNTTGFGYGDYYGQDKYGISVSTPEWVKKQINKIERLELLEYTDRGWGNYQDSVSCIKSI